ncbi:m-AAA protease-interacting protein 1, mitochondrial-like [Centruroides sculpturatus]|uniref:m-AAA protease-interacting protein 1, mitochondrial-like n=1 Tax=Centruroides sculpturatus TaxID=218467 RepID=UPI000C6D340C|nr:m-AAA protease-interacting protein 1, mitochondrial-like [Centruroides sculpturatus]
MAVVLRCHTADRLFTIIKKFKIQHARTLIHIKNDLFSNRQVYKLIRSGGMCSLDKEKIRWCSKDSKEEETSKNLMEFPPVVWPGLFMSIKNWILTKLIIQPYFEPEFDQPSFLKGAKQALVHVSNLLAKGDIDALKGLITSEALSEIQRSYTIMNLKQRQDLQIKLEEIFFSFIYQIGIIMEDDSKKRYVEITVVCHCIHGIEDYQDDVTLSGIKSNLTQNIEKVTVCNYRFIREFTKGVEDSWIINKLNHFKLKQL